MELYLIRHGQSANNAMPEKDRLEDPPLTDVGHRQAAHLAEWIQSKQLTQLITSPFQRTLQTTEHVRVATELSPQIWTDLHEQGGCVSGGDFASFEGRPGMTGRQIAAKFPQYELPDDIDQHGWWKSKDYETASEAQDRARRVSRRTIDEFAHTSHRVAYVLHGTFMRMLVAALLSVPGSEDDWLGEACNSAVTKIDVVDGWTRLDFYNARSHLPAPLVTY